MQTGFTVDILRNVTQLLFERKILNISHLYLNKFSPLNNLGYLAVDLNHLVFDNTLKVSGINCELRPRLVAL